MMLVSTRYSSQHLEEVIQVNICAVCFANLQQRCNMRLAKKKENEPRSLEPTKEKRSWMTGRV
ncbi:hypothetical protein K443DRAFT_219796 [Laccaria amethystina LaAM-08-1]|uniref:Unplaced genomic scaffold K443scaffold_141, whole genome shotgun sequence n=1 Tax=Laccaria amethystina LaAM-08-1 TaxID=1095629 RepID=A0A0C9WZ24_9AGAR|nr:hypothetical protein K443DRAFT_219796 [Laccaria amethystina LaAM-08-1]